MLKFIYQTSTLSCLAIIAFVLPLSTFAQTTPTNTGAQNSTRSLACLDLTANLVIGIDDETETAGPVHKLQTFLIASGYLDISDSNNKPTGYFGRLTQAAVIKFQTAYNITPAVGYVGMLTRAKIKEVTCSGRTSASTGTTPTPTPTPTPTTANSLAAYNSNNGWWLSPVTLPPTTTPSSTGTPNNPVMPTTTPPVATTPPTDCAQYAGVIPGETRKARVEERGFYQRITYNSRYPVSALAREQSKLIKGRIYGGGFSFSHLARTRMAIPSGTVLAYRFKTTEYNYGLWSRYFMYSHPGTPTGVVIWSVSKCPGDFTSPTLLSQKAEGSNDVHNLYGDQQWRKCVSYSAPIASVFEFGINTASPTLCNLEPNTTYYVNVSAGFAGGGEKGNLTPHIGTFGGTRVPDGTEMNLDFVIQDHYVGGDGTNLIKGMEEYYSEGRRVGDLWNQDVNRNMDEIIRTGVQSPMPPVPQF